MLIRERISLYLSANICSRGISPVGSLSVLHPVAVMSQNFRIASVEDDPLLTKLIKEIKVFPNSSKDLPVKIDCEKRFGVFFSYAENYLDKIRDFDVRKDDIWIITMPKCGTTWMLELVWLLMNNMDFDTALKVDQEARCPYLEFGALYPLLKDSVEEISKMDSPRLIKSHLPMHMLPKGLWTVKPKIIYITRDPKEASVSFYHYLAGLGANKVTQEEFIAVYLKDSLPFQPFWSHVVEFWQIRDEPNVFFTSFERMTKDLKSIVLGVCKFLGKSIDDAQMERMLEHLSVSEMKNNPACNHMKVNTSLQKIADAEDHSFRFMGTGTVGSYKEELDGEVIEKIEEWTKKSLEPYGVTLEEIIFS